MDAIIITPYVGIGPFRLGMNREEVEQVFLDFVDWKLEDGTAANPSLIEMLFIREHFEYDTNGQVKFIQLINPNYLSQINIPCLFQGVDVFTTKAEELIHTLRKEHSMIGDFDPKTGYTFGIKELELCLWREGIMNEDILKDPGFLEMSEENQELEKRYSYFTTISIGTTGYLDFMDDYPGR